VYWTELFYDKIMRANLDGTNAEDIVIGIDAAHSIVVDTLADKIYWPEAVSGKIQRANLDGSAVEDVIVGLDDPVTLALDLPNGKMYWTNSGGQQSNHIARANLNGSGIETIISDVGAPWGIAIAPDPAPVPGDYNRNGTVDAADYLVWRDKVFRPGILPNQIGGGNPFFIDLEDYRYWAANFGRTAASDAFVETLVPEPSSMLILVIGAIAAAAHWQNAQRSASDCGNNLRK
jgi:DNA-binding beta-propeller fold protein YncE